MLTLLRRLLSRWLDGWRMAADMLDHENEIKRRQETDDPYQSEDYQRFLEEAAKHCRCCSVCGNPPCDGCLAGAPCDDMPCRCGGHNGRDYNDEEGY